MVTLDEAGAARRWTRITAPPPALEPFVEYLWTQSGDGQGKATGRDWRIVPDAAAHIVVKRLAGKAGDTPGSTRATLVGARSRYVDSDLPRRAWTAGVRFHAGVLPLLTRLPATDLTDRGVRLANALGPEGTRLEADLPAAYQPEEAVVLLESMLLRVLRRAERPDPRVRHLAALAGAAGDMSAGAAPTIRRLADRIGVAERTLRQRCTDDIGMSPVLVVRVQRLHRAIGLALDRAHGNWARLAALAGYFDQPHLIREFGSLLGETPRAFIARRTRSDHGVA